MELRASRSPDARAQPLSLRDKAYLEIKRRINRLDYRPGTYLNEAQISRLLNIGRTPVHQALDRLMWEGLVQVIPRKGIVVESISLDQVLQILDVRQVNEPCCAGLAAERATPSENIAMRDLLNSASQLIKSRNREQLMNLDRQFHNKISHAAHNPILANMITMLHERSLRFWFISLGDDLQLRRVHEEHGRVLDAIERHDRKGAVSAMSAHIESSRKHIICAI